MNKFKMNKKPLMAIIEITNRCNINCPICFSNANNPSKDVPFNEIVKRFNNLIKHSGSVIPIQISGGEPTVRDDLSEIIQEARKIGFKNIDLITNGIKISQSSNYLKMLKCSGLTAIYLQFDGLHKNTYMKIRGQDMTSIRIKAIESCRKNKIQVTLAVVVTKNINDYEIGDIINFAIKNIDVVRAINFQSAMNFEKGRFEIDQENYQGFSVKDIIGLICDKTDGLTDDSFSNDHLGHPVCNKMAIVFPKNNKIRSIFDLIDSKTIKKIMNNQEDKTLELFEGRKKFLLKNIFNLHFLKAICKLIPIIGFNIFNIFKANHLTLFVKSFMNNSTIDPERINQCCYGISDDGGIYSFCEFNNYKRKSN